MPLKWTSTDQASAAHGVKVLVYGEPGAGKTGLIETLPVPVVLSAESGLLRLRHVRIPVIQIGTMDDLMEAYRWAAASHEARQFHSLALDSISEIAEVVLSKQKAGSKDPRQAYGQMIEIMEAGVRAFRDLPGKHVYMSAKQEPIKDEASGGIFKWGPSMPGAKLGNNLPYFFDEVFRIGVNRDQQGNTYRFLQTQGDNRYIAKDRSGALDAWEPPHLGHVINKIMGVA